MRYLFRGLIRESGRPVEGHVEGGTEEDAYTQLSSNGVVTESLVPDPKALNLNEELPQSPEFANALESAFDSSSSQVAFDDLTQRYTGKKVWVIDRDKIRRRVAQVVDAALALAAQHSEGSTQTRERVQSALQGFFSDNRNLASERNADSIAGIRFNGANGGANGAPPPPPLPPAPVMPASARLGGYMPATNGGGSLTAGGHPGLEGQIARMANLVKQAEATLAAVAAAARRGGGGGGGGGGGRRFSAKGGKGEEQNSVLLEIFKSNLELVRTMQDPTAAPADNAGAGEVSVGSAGESAGNESVAVSEGSPDDTIAAETINPA